MVPDHGQRTTDFIIATLVINFDGTVYSPGEDYPNVAWTQPVVVDPAGR